MGTAHINIHPSVYDAVVGREDISFISVGDFGDGTLFCLVCTSLLSEGYHGHMNLVLTNDEKGTILRLKKDMDT